ncbi:MAG: glutamate mutase L [Emergencia sp.]
MKYTVLADFGSTYTKVVCVDLEERRIVLTDKFPSTVHLDAEIGLNQCFDAVKAVIGEEEFSAARKLATSSAAGGLRMAVSGLTESLSIEAGRNASFSAGGKIVCTMSGSVTEEMVREAEEAGAEILLLCGGYEGGNTRMVLRNAKILSQSTLTIPVIYAGNSMVAREIRGMFQSSGKECFLAENIIPAIGELNIESTTEIIRNIFMNRITNMKGVGAVQNRLDGPIIPTPAAVLQAGELLSTGTARQEGLGPFMMADIGGATTDIYSYAENESFSGAKCVGAQEPFARRTVEGDMGMRESSVCLVKETGSARFAQMCGISESRLEQAVTRRITQTDYLADSEEEKEIDRNIACAAVRISARRHAGYVTREFSSGGYLVQHGKNLTGIRTVIGTGGIIVNNEDPGSILRNVCADESEKDRILLPEKTGILVDRDYVLFAAGLLREYDEDAAFAIMKQSLGV